MADKPDQEALREQFPCTFCNGREGGCAKCNFTGVKGFSGLADIIKSKDKAIGQGYCRWHGRYQGKSCPHPSHEQELQE